MLTTLKTAIRIGDETLPAGAWVNVYCYTDNDGLSSFSAQHLNIYGLQRTGFEDCVCINTNDAHFYLNGFIELDFGNHDAYNAESWEYGQHSLNAQHPSTSIIGLPCHVLGFDCNSMPSMPMAISELHADMEMLENIRTNFPADVWPWHPATPIY